MKLYHGTTEAVARKALKEGLKPRIATGHRGNWDHTCKSHPSMVYLTTVYAPYFGLCAIKDTSLQKHGIIRPPARDAKFGIVEVDTFLMDPQWFRPDEDFIEQALAREPQPLCPIKGKTQQERTLYIRDHLDQFKPNWQLSVENLGTCAYKGSIPASAITKVVIVSRDNAHMELQATDPVICIDNYTYCRRKYEALTAWFMGQPVTVDQWFTANGVNPLLTPEQLEKAKKEWAEYLADQNGIEVLFSRPG